MGSILQKLSHYQAIETILISVEGWHDEMVEIVQNWSKINSGSRNLEGLGRMEQEIVKAFEPLGAEVSLIDLGEGDLVNAEGALETVANGRSIKFAKNPEANRRILMTGHTDTVFPTDSEFQEPKWLDDNTINGPGVADMKGGIIVILNALKAFEASPYAGSIGWEVILSPDEETGSLKSGPILMDRARSADIGLTYEPALADGTLAGERKGSGNFTLVVRGRAAHAGREFHNGRNAVVALSEIIGELAALTDGRPELTVNPAVIKGGVAPNVVPDMAWCKFNVRLSEPEHGEWFESKLNEIMDRWEDKDGFELMLHGGINRPPKKISDANRIMMDLVQACGTDLDININYVATGGCCEGNNLAAAGLPNIDTLGVRGGAIHSHDEFVLVDSFVERVKLSTLIMAAFADGQFDDVIKAKQE
jgi:glutamate carboxypeptidase